MAELINIDQLTSGTIVRVALVSSARSRLFNFVPKIDGLFRVFSGGEIHNLDRRVLKKIVSFTKRKFRAVVINNDVVNRRLTLQISEPRKLNLFYEVVIPYNQISKISRLVFQDLPNLTPKKEEIRRRRLRTREAAENNFTNPFDRFVAVSTRR